jgi:N-acetylmuramoyl-L-alanine amidase
MRAKQIAAVALLVAGAAAGQAPRTTPLRVTGVRHWSLDGVTRVAIDITGEFQFHTERLHNPERVFFDIFRARPSFDGKRTWSSDVTDKLVQKVRVAETLPGVTRIVLDLATPVDYTASRMSNPERLVIELRPAAAQSSPLAPSVSARPSAPAASPGIPPDSTAPNMPADRPAAAPAMTPAAPATQPANAPSSGAASSTPPASPAPSKPSAKTAAPDPATSRAETGTAAKRTSDGKNSLIRALGLKINRVVIDPGHGGHDQGTVGPRGVMEKELVLDVAKRLGDLMQRQLGCEVVYTRTDDEFVPLEGRTALANDRKADLFISLHANSSRYPRIAGVETFFLNFTSSRDALDVASRENAASQKSISELQDLLQKIAKQEKIEESKELAGRIQSSMFTFSARYNPGIRNRGVKKAPFVVLVGAQMPSVLVEIGFLSNSREEILLKRADHRQRVADALLRGITRYAQGLSHFQMAQAGPDE